MHGRGASFEIEREELMLLPDRAIFWPSVSALLVADLHIGKGASFRAGAVALPAGSSESTLHRLTNLLTGTEAKRLYMLGDFWHARQGRTERIEDLIKEWRNGHVGVEMLLVQGNHDLKSGALREDLNINTVADERVGPFILKHHPEEDGRGYVLCGHVHPAVRLIGLGRQTERLPAFWFGPKIGMLPSFGDFTGSATIYPAPGDRVFVTGDDFVQQVGLTGAGTA